jgi:two-component system sensor histidine kinase CpxA
MKSLFVRVLVSMWLTMTLIGCLFAVIHALAFAARPDDGRRSFTARYLETRGEATLRCIDRAGTDCERYLLANDPRDHRMAIYRDGTLVAGAPIDGAAALIATAAGSADRMALHSDDVETTAVRAPNDPGYAFVATGPVRSPWMFFLVPHTLVWRILAIIAVSGLVSALLARYLSRPIRELRRAAQSMAGGDLSVRVAPRLGGADTETSALGADMDRMAERIDALLEAQRRLLRDVSHELRSPLARLGIALELLRRKSSSEAAPALDRIERETERLNLMIGELLTLSRLESGQAIEKPEAVELGALVEAVVADVSYEAAQQDKQVVVGRRDDCVLEGREELLRRAVENVLRNAVRFTANGSAVEIELARAGDRATLTVRDHGPGVPEEALADIFKPFYRVGDDRARTSGGTGIGLAITERAVVLHGGHVVAENVRSDGGGLSIRMTLPVRTV